MIRLNILYNSGAERVIHLPDPPPEEATPAEAALLLFEKVHELDSIWITDALTGKPVFVRCRDFQHVETEFIGEVVSNDPVAYAEPEAVAA